MIPQVEKIVLDKLSDRIIKRGLQRSGDQVIGIGISWLWQLPETHKFQVCAVRHDAFYDAVEILSGLKKFEDLPSIPQGYRDYVRIAIEAYNARTTKSYLAFIQDADREFYHQCLKIANHNNSYLLRFQAELFYFLVKKWSRMKFKEYDRS